MRRQIMPTPIPSSWAHLSANPLKIVFIAGPYIGDGSIETIESNIREAEAYAIALANHGIGFFCPHLHTHHFGTKANADETFYHQLDFHFLTQADGILLTPRWNTSSGAKRERDWAMAKGLPLFYPKSPEHMNELIAWNDRAAYNSPNELP
jgi:hypothetical protein